MNDLLIAKSDARELLENAATASIGPDGADKIKQQLRDIGSELNDADKAKWFLWLPIAFALVDSFLDQSQLQKIKPFQTSLQEIVEPAEEALQDAPVTELSYNKDAKVPLYEICPKCGSRAISSCRCRIGSRRCSCGCEWYMKDGVTYSGNGHKEQGEVIERQSKVVAKRVGLEITDYAQILVDKYGCDANDLGEVKMVGGLLNVEGSVYIGLIRRLTELPFKFGRVRGNFHCNGTHLTSLEGAPRYVGGSFHCNGNKLTSLEGAPRFVEGDFDCSDNLLASLEGAPRIIGCSFHCARNHLTSLKGAPDVVGVHFNCQSNSLTSLEGAPRKIGMNLVCRNNRLPTDFEKPAGLEGALIK